MLKKAPATLYAGTGAIFSFIDCMYSLRFAIILPTDRPFFLSKQTIHVTTHWMAVVSL
jgi:hypothetical protein